MSVTTPHKQETADVSKAAATIHAELGNLEMHTHAAVVAVVTQLMQHRHQHMQAQQIYDQQAGTSALRAN
jgi:aspartate ammonia-lyase